MQGTIINQTLTITWQKGIMSAASIKSEEDRTGHKGYTSMGDNNNCVDPTIELRGRIDMVDLIYYVTFCVILMSCSYPKLEPPL